MPWRQWKIHAEHAQVCSWQIEDPMYERTYETLILEPSTCVLDPIKCDLRSPMSCPQATTTSKINLRNRLSAVYQLVSCKGANATLKSISVVAYLEARPTPFSGLHARPRYCSGGGRRGDESLPSLSLPWVFCFPMSCRF